MANFQARYVRLHTSTATDLLDGWHRYKPLQDVLGDNSFDGDSIEGEVMFTHLNGRDCISRQASQLCTCHMEVVCIDSLSHLQPGDIILSISEPSFSRGYSADMVSVLSDPSDRNDDNVSMPSLERIDYPDSDEGNDNPPQTSSPHVGSDTASGVDCVEHGSDGADNHSIISDVLRSPEVCHKNYYQVRVWRVRDQLKEVMTHPRFIRPSEIYLDWTMGELFDSIEFFSRFKVCGKSVQETYPTHTSLLPDSSLRTITVVYGHTSCQNLLTIPTYAACQSLWFDFMPDEFISDTVRAFIRIMEKAASTHAFNIPNFQVAVEPCIAINDSMTLMGMIYIPSSAIMNEHPRRKEHLTLNIALALMSNPLQIVLTLLHEFAHLLADFSRHGNPDVLKVHDQHWVRAFAFLIRELNFVAHGHALHSLFTTACDGYDKTWGDFLYIWPYGCV